MELPVIWWYNIISKASGMGEGVATVLKTYRAGTGVYILREK